MKEPIGTEGRRLTGRPNSPEERWTEQTDSRLPADAAGAPFAASREDRIAVLAYYKAERRGFEGDHELDDWLEAEREVDGSSQRRDTLGDGMSNEEER